MSTMHEALFADFYSEALPIELPELSFMDVEGLVGAGEDEETAQPTTDDLPAAEETVEQQEVRTAAEREYLVRQRHYADLDAQLSCVITDDNPFSVSPTMAREVKAFRSVVSRYCTMRNQSVLGIARYYSGQAAGTRKAYKPNCNDFYCDVELKAKEALTPNLFRLFDKKILQEFGERWADVPLSLRTVIESRVGLAFARARIFPLPRYFS